MTRDAANTYDQPLEVEAYAGEVVITGPASVGFALTAAAAAETADRLALAARHASNQGPAKPE